MIFPFEITEVDTILRGLHILIVEDQTKINQVITKKMLSKRKLPLTSPIMCLEAVAIGRKTDYDCILMDIHMPGISGRRSHV